MPDLKFYINAVEQEDAIKFARFKDDVDELFAGLVAEYNLSSSAEEFILPPKIEDQFKDSHCVASPMYRRLLALGYSEVPGLVERFDIEPYSDFSANNQTL